MERGNSANRNPRILSRQHYMNRHHNASGSPFGRPLFVPLLVINIALMILGLKLLNEPTYICLILAGVLALARHLCLRHESLQGWGKAGYLATALVSVVLATFGLYELGVEVSDASTSEYPMRHQIQSNNARLAEEDRISREEIEARIQKLEGELAELSGHPSTPIRNRKMAGIEDELRLLIEKLQDSSSNYVQLVTTPSLLNRLNNEFEKSGIQNDDVIPQSRIGARGRSLSSTGERPSPAMIGKSQPMLSPNNRFEEFVAATIALAANAITCWIMISIIEISILMLSRPRHSHPG